jgi:hypothetical protein
MNANKRRKKDERTSHEGTNAEEKQHTRDQKRAKNSKPIEKNYTTVTN